MKSNDQQISITEKTGSFNQGLGITDERAVEIRKEVGKICGTYAGDPDEQALTTASVYNEFEDKNECAYALSMVNLEGTGCVINPAFKVPEVVAEATSSSL